MGFAITTRTFTIPSPSCRKTEEPTRRDVTAQFSAPVSTPVLCNLATSLVSRHCNVVWFESDLEICMLWYKSFKQNFWRAARLWKNSCLDVCITAYRSRALHYNIFRNFMFLKTFLNCTFIKVMCIISCCVLSQLFGRSVFADTDPHTIHRRHWRERVDDIIIIVILLTSAGPMVTTE